MTILLATLLVLALAYLIPTVLAHVLTAAPAWWARNIIDADPNPEPSFLDVADWLYPEYVRQCQAKERSDGL